MKKDETGEIDQLFGDISDKLSTVKSETEISLEIQAEYISYHKKIDLEKYEENKMIKESSKLFKENISDEDKKKILFILAHIGTLPCVRAIEEYMNKASSDMKAWAVLAFEEGWMFLESEAMGTAQTKIFGGAGRDEKGIRYYFVISSKDNFTDEQKNMIESKFAETAGKLDSKIEKIDFKDSHALIKVLVSFDIAVGDLIEAGIKSCNGENKFLRFHCFVTDTHKPTEKEIGSYLDGLKNE